MATKWRYCKHCAETEGAAQQIKQQAVTRLLPHDLGKTQYSLATRYTLGVPTKARNSWLMTGAVPGGTGGLATWKGQTTTKKPGPKSSTFAMTGG